VDSGCSFHVCPNKEFFHDYVNQEGGNVLLGDDSSCKVVGIGSVKIRMFDGMVRTLTSVRHIPALAKNLISLGALENLGCSFMSEGGYLNVLRNSKVLMKAKRVRNLYELIGDTIVGGASVVQNSNDANAFQLWHERLGHMSERGLRLLIKRNLLLGVKPSTLKFCEHCVFGKQKKVQFQLSSTTSGGILEYIHSDVWGPSPHKSITGLEYFVTFVDDFSRMCWVFFLKQKSEVFETFRGWKTQVELQTGKKVKCIRSDNGGEYRSKEFDEYCASQGIVRHFTVPENPQQNGVAERLNRTLLEKARSMCSKAQLSKQFWAEAVNYSRFLVNVSPHSAIGFQTPFELWHGRPADYSVVKVFGSPAYALTPQSQRTKLDPKSKKCNFLGYNSGVKGYRLWDPEAGKLIVSRDVIFDESQPFVQPNDIPVVEVPSTVETEIEKVQVESHSEPETAEPLETEEPAVVAEVPLRRSTRERRPVDRYIPPDTRDLAVALLTEDGDPSSFEEAMKSPDRDMWIAAMNSEMNSLLSTKSWRLVNLPKGAKVVECRWVFKKKQDGVYKARLVAKGYTQRQGIDYTEVFSPVVKLTTIRALLAIVSMFDLELDQMDVITAFLHGLLEETIYMRQPEGFVASGATQQVCHLLKSLYGLKQSPRQWYKRFDSFMVHIGFIRSDYDCCVYIKEVEKSKSFRYIILVLYVDDMLIAAEDRSEISKLKELLSKEFSMKDLGESKTILGMDIHRDRSLRRLWLTQSRYVKKVLHKFGMETAKPVSTPLAPHFRFSQEDCPKTQGEKDVMSNIPYDSAVGSLIYAATCTRPDISQAVSTVSRYMSNPGKPHWEAVKWILRYLRGTTEHGILFDGAKAEKLSLSGFVDSDYGGNVDTRKSTTGFVFLLGGCVSWRSASQSCVALSSTEAEYMAATEATKEAIWLQRMVSDLGLKHGPIQLQCDSQSALHLAKNPVFHARTKHIDIRYHFIREAVSEQKILLLKVDTKENAADMLTKVVTTEKFSHCLGLINVLPRISSKGVIVK
jgi:Reverse transcriptase (RNA-dependent DNA polymerase)/GAG-pre-integrase domain/Integrase core domain